MGQCASDWHKQKAANVTPIESRMHMLIDVCADHCMQPHVWGDPMLYSYPNQFSFGCRQSRRLALIPQSCRCTKAGRFQVQEMSTLLLQASVRSWLEHIMPCHSTPTVTNELKLGWMGCIKPSTESALACAHAWLP